MRIVIVEDEVKIREGIAKMIESQTEHVVQGKAVNGEEGLEMALRFKPDLVITDVRMPKMDGLEMVKTLYERKAPFHAVILSGYSEFEYAQKAIRYGVDEYLLKPLDIDDIINMLDKVEKKIQREQMANGTPGMYIRNLIVGKENDTDKICGILKDVCGFPGEGEYELFAGYIGSAESSYRDVIEQAVEELKKKYQEWKIYYLYMENRQNAYLLGCSEKDDPKARALVKSVYNRLILRYQDKNEKAIWTKKEFTRPEQIRDAAKELDGLLSYALVIKPEGWLDAGQVKYYSAQPFVPPVSVYNQIRNAICRDDMPTLEKGMEDFLAYMKKGILKPGRYGKPL